MVVNMSDLGLSIRWAAFGVLFFGAVAEAAPKKSTPSAAHQILRPTSLMFTAIS